MTDQPTPTDDDLSLALDGEADAELLARIDASPDAQARLEQLRAAAARVGAADVPPLDDDAVDALITTALDTPVAPSRGASTGRGTTPWLVAAAVILLMAVGLSLVWAGRGTEEDQAGASRTSAELQDSSAADGAGAEADSSFSEAGGAAGSASEGSGLPGGHGSPTTIPADTATTSSAPVLYLGSFPSGDALREATASSFADAWKASDERLSYDGPDADDGATNRNGMAVPSEAAVARCAQQLQVTLKLEDGAVQTGFATVDDQDVLVYEFPATSARNGEETTLVAAVGQDACDEVVIFER